MRFNPRLEEFRIRSGEYCSDPGDDFGSFAMRGPCGENLFIIASSGDHTAGIEWEHVSVSTRRRCPNWIEMCFVKDLFWDEEEAVMQVHPPKSRWINNHPYCLHMWRPTSQDIPLPPDIAVGIKELGTIQAE